MKYLLLLTTCILLTSCGGSKTYIEHPVVMEKPVHYDPPPVVIERERTIEK